MKVIFLGLKSTHVMSANEVLVMHPGLMITTLVSYLSHSQIWALQQGSDLHIGGRTNRATFAFQQEMEDVMQAMPERLPPRSTQQAAGSIGQLPDKQAVVLVEQASTSE